MGAIPVPGPTKIIGRPVNTGNVGVTVVTVVTGGGGGSGVIVVVVVVLLLAGIVPGIFPYGYSVE